MRYTMLLKPHANARYRQSLQQLATIELQTMLQAFCPGCAVTAAEFGGEPFLCFETDEMSDGLLKMLSRHSGCALLCELLPDGLLRPVQRRPDWYLPEELAQVLKYKGKTNADFTMMLINCALAASGFAKDEKPLTVLDPVCGKATTAFCALSLGHNAIGVDRDEKALHEADTYFARSLKLNRYKHKRTTASQTLTGGGHVQTVQYTVAQDADKQKQGDTRTLQLISGDSGQLGRMMKHASCHLIVGDLPYGVQHAPQEGHGFSSPERLLSRIAQGCAQVLKPGGVAAFSFNAFTLSRQKAAAALEAAGLEPLVQPPFDGFAHWVEQAVERDAVLARKL
ncbi:MAG: hypothetical protein IKK08_12155 [Clostridia bacterium]|nr:hypothetical protein [Clostridia bacterium]